MTAAAAAGLGALGGPAAHATEPPPAPGAPVWSAEYGATKGSVALAMFRKRVGEPRAGERPRPVLVFVHGSSISSRPSFDLTVPGAGEHSLMNVFARWGYDTWTLDHEGYGRSSRTDGNADVASGVEDLKAAAEVIARETGRARFHFYGGSSGGLRAGAFAMARPERVDRLILEAFTWTASGRRASPTSARTTGARAGAT